MKRKISRIFAMFMAALRIISLRRHMAFAAEEIPIDAVHFPDDNFRNFIIAG